MARLDMQDGLRDWPTNLENAFALELHKHVQNMIQKHPFTPKDYRAGSEVGT